MADELASTKLLCLDADGREFPASIALGRPYRAGGKRLPGECLPRIGIMMLAARSLSELQTNSLLRSDFYGRPTLNAPSAITLK